MDWVKIVADLVLPILGIVLTAVVVPLCKEWLQHRYAKQLVTAAEQLFGSGTGFLKREYVSEHLQNRWKLSEEQVEILIESAVGELGKVWDKVKDIQGEETQGYE